MIRFFMAILFASPEQLGWDPTMVRDKNTGQYDITVRGQDGTEQVYRTLEFINTAKANTLLGRATRVARCLELGPDGQPVSDKAVALKDCWIGATRAREGHNYDDLIAATGSDQRLRARLKAFLLTVICHMLAIPSMLPETLQTITQSMEWSS